MKLNTLAHGETWMRPDETELNRELIDGITELLQERGVKENPLLAIRVSDVAVSLLLTRRLEDGLAPEDGEPETRTTAAQAESIGKTRERLRKAVKDFEDYCDRVGTPIGTGLAELMRPIVQQVQGGSPFFTPGER